MSFFNGLSGRVKEAREQRGMSITQFAELIDCKPEMLELLEQGRPISERHGLLPVLERIARGVGISIDVLLFADTSLFSVRTSDLKLQAWRIIRDNQFTSSLPVIDHVFEQIERDYQASLAEQRSGAIAFRGEGAGYSIDDDRVYEMVRVAKLAL